MTRRCGALALAVLAAVVSGCATSTAASITGSTRPASTTGAFPVTIDAANGTVTVAARPTRVVSMSATATEMLYAVGAGPQVAAVDRDSTYPSTAPRTGLDSTSPNVEAIVADHPDLVVVAGDTTGLTGSLAAFHVPVLSLPAAASLADVYRQFAEIGAATGHPAAAASLRRRIAAIAASVPRPATHPTYYYELDQTLYSATSATFIGKMLGLLGLANIADAVSTSADAGYPQLSAEYIIRANPDYIFLADTKCCGQNAATVAARPGWDQLAAVTHHHVVGLDDDIASRWGPRIVLLLQTVANAINHRSSAGASP